MAESSGRVGGVSHVLDERAFRNCLGQFATGVTVMTARVRDKNVAVTANSFSALSISPPLVLWSIGRKSRSCAAFETSKHFAVNVLGKSQVQLSQNFASRAEDKFAGIAWDAGIATGAPLIGGAIAHLECTTERVLDGGDHIIIVGNVARFDQFDGEPLLFAQGRYGLMVDHPDVMSEKTARPDGQHEPSVADVPIFRRIFNAFYALAARFEEHREAEGLSAPQLRALMMLHEAPGISKQELFNRMFLPQSVARDALAEVRERGFVEAGAAGGLRLTVTGAARRQAVGLREQKFEADQVAGFTKDELVAGRRFLDKLIHLNRSGP